MTIPAHPARWIVLLASLAGSFAWAQEPGRVYKDRIEAHWFNRDASFWYRNDLRGGQREFVLVDAERGQRRAAFDHAKAAEALSKAMGKRIEAGRLPIDDLVFGEAGKTVLIVSGGKGWRLNLATYEVAPTAAGEVPAAVALGLKPLPRPHASRAGGGDSAITFINKTKQPIALDWIDTENNPKRYATIKPGESHEQHTFAGHVWAVSDPAGKSLGAYEARPNPATAVIETKALNPAMEDDSVSDSTFAPQDSPVDFQDTQNSALKTQDFSGTQNFFLNPADAPSPPRRRDRTRPRSDSPDGKFTAIVRDFKLIVRANASNEEIILGDDGKVSDAYSEGQVWWSPDSTHLVALRTEPAQEHKIYEVESSPKDQVQPKLRTLDYLKPGDKIAHPRPALFDVAARKRVPIKEDLFPTPWSIGDLRWAADSSRFTFLYNQRGHHALRVIAIDARSGETRAIIDEHSDTFICYSGKFLCQWIGEEEILWMSERDGWSHLYLYDVRAGAKSGAVKNQVTKGEWVIQKIVRVDPEKRQVWFMAGGIRPGQDPYYSHFARVNFDGSGLTILTEGDGTHTVQWEAGRKTFIDTFSRVDLPPVHQLRSAEDGRLITALEEADAADVLAGRGGRWPVPFSAKGRDGKTDIFGAIILPRDFDAKKRYPVVEQIYAGPQGFFAPKAFRTRWGTMQQLADRGMIIVQCDGMGTSGRSKAFHDVCWKNLKDAGFADRIAWIKAAAGKFPQMDLSRVGIYGGSAGGQNALAALLWHGDFYKVAVADCGCHDNRMDKIWWNEQWMGWPVDKSYEESSNVVNAHLLRSDAKLLLLVGEVDSNVDPASTMQVAAALQKAGKDYEMVIVAGSNHGSAETPYGSKKRLEFLTANLIGK